MCTAHTENDCGATGGIYLGDDTDCSGAGTVVDATALSRDIPDNDPAGGISHTLNMAESFDLQDVDVWIHIIHTWTGDLVVEVEHLGTTATLISQPGDATDTPGPPYGCSSDDYDIILDDEGSGGPIEIQCSANLSSPPNYTPNNPLHVFDGMDSAGGWTIKVTDTGEGETGVLRGWGVHMQGAAGAGPCDGIFPGACCDRVTGTCTDDVMEADCSGDQLEWFKNALCAEIVCEQHTGAEPARMTFCPEIARATKTSGSRTRRAAPSHVSSTPALVATGPPASARMKCCPATAQAASRNGSRT
jgi:subtilisin-like proprotein convertase family protein